jgi:hypothetical protein
MGSNLVSYLVLLVAGTALTVAVGVALRRSGQAMLEEVYPGPRAVGVIRMVEVGFYLVAFGVLALISTVSVPVEGQVQMVVTKFGVVLLVLGAAHGFTALVLGRIRDAGRRAELDRRLTAAVRTRA